MSAKRHFFVIALILTFLSTMAATGAEKPSILPIKKWSTSTGTPVFYVYEAELPMVDIQVIFDAGSSRDLMQPGLAKITNEALSSGTTTMSANDIAAAFDNVGAQFSAAVNRDMAIVALRTLSDPKYFQPAYNTFTEVLTKAHFPDNEFKRIQKQTLNLLEEQEEQPSSIASKAFYSAVFDNNPYGHPITGTKQSIERLGVSDLAKFYKQFYSARNSFIAIVGNIKEEQAKVIAENLSTHLPLGEALIGLDYKTKPDAERNRHIAFPSSQTHVLIGQTGISRKDPSYFPMVVGNYILGGGTLTSRLFDEVREKRGLAYSVRSQFSALRDRGPFIIELQTRNSEANNAIKIVNDTLTKFVQVGPTAQELNSAKKNLTQGFILRLASNSAIISQLVNIGYYQLPLDYLDSYQNNISKVTDQQIKTVFQSLIHPTNLITVTVGNNAAEKNAQTKPS
ncbi:MAG: insulinase family protein [Gammaproteobacteria bacterium]|nr:insulinase family protein [Gammaproteobacteria bacterium]